MSTERRECQSRDCEETISASVESDFCFGCLSVLARDREELYADIEKVLRLEAEFVRYCAERGLPNPHD